MYFMVHMPHLTLQYVQTELTRKMVPITGRASSLLEIFCMYDKRFEISKTKRSGGGNRTTDLRIYARLKHSPQTTSTPPNLSLYHTQ